MTLTLHPVGVRRPVNSSFSFRNSSSDPVSPCTVPTEGTVPVGKSHLLASRRQPPEATTAYPQALRPDRQLWLNSH